MVSGAVTLIDSAWLAVRLAPSVARTVKLDVPAAEGVPLISLLVPSTPLFLGIGAAHAAAGGQFWELCIAGAVGATLSDLLVYMIGRTYKDEAQRIWPFSRYQGWLPKGQALIERWGLLAVAGGAAAADGQSPSATAGPGQAPCRRRTAAPTAPGSFSKAPPVPWPPMARRPATRRTAT